MVFGLATKKEINKINQMKNDMIYCNGRYQLSKIQFFVLRNISFHAQIRSKSILTPYAFTCLKSYSLKAEFEYLNGNNHLDYRCQYVKTTLLVYLFLILVISLSFTVIYCYRSFYHLSKNAIIPIIFFCFICIFFFLHDICAYYFFKSQQDKEYFNEDEIISSGYFLFAIFVFVFCSIFLHALEIYIHVLYYKNRYLIILILVTILQLTLLLSIFPLQILIFLDISSRKLIVCIALYSVFFLISIIIPPILKITKLGLIISFTGYFGTLFLGIYLVYTTQEEISTHYLVAILAIIFMITQLTSFILIIIGFYYCNDAKIDFIGNSPIYAPQVNYMNTDIENQDNYKDVQYKPEKPNININNDGDENAVYQHGNVYISNPHNDAETYSIENPYLSIS